MASVTGSWDAAVLIQGIGSTQRQLCMPKSNRSVYPCMQVRRTFGHCLGCLLQQPAWCGSQSRPSPSAALAPLAGAYRAGRQVQFRRLAVAIAFYIGGQHLILIRPFNNIDAECLPTNGALSIHKCLDLLCTHSTSPKPHPCQSPPFPAQCTHQPSVSCSAATAMMALSAWSYSTKAWGAWFSGRMPPLLCSPADPRAVCRTQGEGT